MRYLGFVLVLGIATWIAAAEWGGYGLANFLPTGEDPRAGLIALGRIAFYAVIFAGPLVAAFAEGIVRRAGIFLTALLAGAIVTAPLALAHALGV